MKKIFCLLSMLIMPAVSFAGAQYDYSNVTAIDNRDKFLISQYPGGTGTTKNVNWQDLKRLTTAGINWASIPNVSSLNSADRFFIDQSGTNKGLNWTQLQNILPSTSGGWTTDSSTKTVTTYNVGVGSANPVSTLDIGGGTLTAGGITTTQINNPGIVYDVLTAGDTDFWQGVRNDANGTSDDTFQIGIGTTLGTTPRFVINKDGNVGIGTGTVSGKTASLYLMSTNATPAGFILASSAGTVTDRLQLYPTGNGSAIFKRLTSAVVLQFNNSTGGTDLGFDTNNNISIGTATATGKVTIKGSGTTTGKTFELTDSANTATHTILDNGNVGIGSTTPGAILVIPSIKATSGTRYLCIDSTGNVASSASACSGT